MTKTELEDIISVWKILRLYIKVNINTFDPTSNIKVARIVVNKISGHIIIIYFLK